MHLARVRVLKRFWGRFIRKFGSHALSPCEGIETLA